MRWIVMLAVTLGAALTAEAKPAKPAKSVNRFHGQLLSWQQLMKLSDKKQMAYFKAVRELIVYMEETQRKYNVADNSELSDLKYQVAMLMDMVAVMPKANAQEAASAEDGAAIDKQTKENMAALSPTKDQPTPAAAKPASDVPRWVNGTGWFCEKPYRFEQELGTCVHSTASSWVWGPTWYTSGNCPIADGDGADIAISKGGDRSWIQCIPNASWQALSPERRKDLAKGVRYPKGYFDIKKENGSEETVADVLGGGTHLADGTPAVKSGDAGVVPTAGEDPPPKAEESVKKDEEAPKPVETPTCKKPELACQKLSDHERSQLIKKFVRNKPSKCIIGGFFSDYKGPRACQEVRKQGKVGCDNPNEGLCNPTVFCLGMKVDDRVRNHVASLSTSTEKDKKFKDGMQRLIDRSPEIEGTDPKVKMIRIHVCADRRDQNMSRICNEQLKLHVQGKKSRFSDPKLGGKPIGESYVACNSAKVKDVGAQNNWAEFRNEVERQYNQLCMGDEKFSAMFCTECGIIAERILAANNEATGDGCFDGEALKGVPTTAPGEATTIQEKKGG